VFFLVFVLFFLNTAKGQGCLSCTTAYATCSGNAGGNLAAICACNTDYQTCLQSSATACTNELNSFAGVCPAQKAICPSLTCPSASSPCAQCQATYSTCAVSNPTSLCTCVNPWLQCLSSNTCPGADIICGSYSGLCPSNQCATSACGQCIGTFSQCVAQNPLAPCQCLSALGGCVSGCSGTIGSSQFDITCPVYPQCTSINCNVSITLTGCPKCAVDASTCVSNSLQSGAKGVCSCLSTLYSCLTGSTCGVTAFNGLCGAYSGICPDIQCTGSSSNGNSQLASQVVALIKNYQNSVETYLASILNGNVTFGTYTATGNSQTINIVVNIPTSVTIDVFFANFKTSFAAYFNIDPSLVTVVYSTTHQKRAAQSAQVVVQSPSSPAPQSLSIGVIVGISVGGGLLLVVIIVVLVLVFKKQNKPDSV